VTLGDLEVFQIFKWLLTDAERKQLATWVTNAMKNTFKQSKPPSAAAAAATASASSSTRWSSKGKNAAGAGSSDDKANVMKLFG
jgi:hypothetical protein